MCDVVTKENKELPSTPTSMPPKSATECIAEMIACQVQLDKDLAEAKEEAACEEKQRAEEAVQEKQKQEEAATRKKKEHEECERCDMEHRQEEEELAAAKARVARYEVEASVRAEAGESPGGSGASEDDEVRIIGVETKVSDNSLVAKAS